MMKFLYTITAVAAMAVSAAIAGSVADNPWAPGATLPPPAATEDGISVYFSPRGGCTEAIIYEVSQAQNTIDVMAYSFTAAPIAESLLRARDRGVTVRISEPPGTVQPRSSPTRRWTSTSMLPTPFSTTRRC